MLVYIVLVNYNNARDTIECLQSLSELTARESYQVLVCDNASTDSSYEQIAEWLSATDLNNVTLIQAGHNGGFAAGCNVGIVRALADPAMAYVWLLNNDTVVDPQSLNHLLDCMQRDRAIGVAGSTLCYAHRRDIIQAVGGRFVPWLGLSSHLAEGTRYSHIFCQSIKVADLDYIVGASFFMSRQAIERIGLLDENYFLYCEEIDYCTRAKSAGFLLGYAPDSLVYHKEGATTGSAKRIARRARSAFADKCALRSQYLYVRKFHRRLIPVLALFFLLRACRRMVFGDWAGCGRALSASYQSFLGRWPSAEVNVAPATVAV